MNTQSKEYQSAMALGQSLIGKFAQSALLTELTDNGRQRLCAPQMITGFEVVEEFQEPSLMVVIDGVSIFEELIINVH